MFRLKLKDYLFKNSGNVPNIEKNLINRRHQRDIWSPLKICFDIDVRCANLKSINFEHNRTPPASVE